MSISCQKGNTNHTRRELNTVCTKGYQSAMDRSGSRLVEDTPQPCQRRYKGGNDAANIFSSATVPAGGTRSASCMPNHPSLSWALPKADICRNLPCFERTLVTLGAAATWTRTRICLRAITHPANLSCDVPRAEPAQELGLKQDFTRVGSLTRGLLPQARHCPLASGDIAY